VFHGNATRRKPSAKTSQALGEPTQDAPLVAPTDPIGVHRTGFGDHFVTTSLLHQKHEGPGSQMREVDGAIYEGHAAVWRLACSPQQSDKAILWNVQDYVLS
jgi:hypothetical protein